MNTKGNTKESEDVLVNLDLDNNIGTLQLNRPSKLNALRYQTLNSLEENLNLLTNDDRIKVIIITGAGGSFCSGVDIDELAGGKNWGPHKWSKNESIDELRRRFSQSHRIVSMIYRSEKPFIAAIDGIAVGAGLDIACACDIRVSTENARFRSSYIKVGLFPGYGGIWLYQRLIGYAKASELVFTGRWMDSSEALNLGLLNHVYNDDIFFDKLKELSLDISLSAPIPLRLSKMLMRDSANIDFESSLRMAATAEAITLASEDHKEAMESFRLKRQPTFKGK